MTTVGLVLAAGASRRFGPSDKLLAPFRGHPLAEHAARAMRGAPVDHRIAVTASPDVAALFGGFEIVALPEPRLQSDSLRAGLATAIDLGATAVLIALADMPLVDAALLREVLNGPAPAAVKFGDVVVPPALIPQPMFEELGTLSGDRGAGAVLSARPDLRLVKAPSDLLADVDTHDDLEKLPPD